MYIYIYIYIHIYIYILPVGHYLSATTIYETNEQTTSITGFSRYMICTVANQIKLINKIQVSDIAMISNVISQSCR